MHPAPPIGRELHGHPRGRKGVNQCPLGRVPPGADVQHGLCAAHVEPAGRAGIPLWWLQRVLQDVCPLPRRQGGSTERKHRVTGKAGLGRRSSEAAKDLGGYTCSGTREMSEMAKL